MDRGAWWAAVHGVTKSWTWLSDFTFTFHFHALEKEMATHSSVLAWRIPGMGEPGGLLSMGSHRVGHDWSDLAAAAAAEVRIFWVFGRCFLPRPLRVPCLHAHRLTWHHSVVSPNSKLTQGFLSPAPHPPSNEFLCLCFHLSEWHRFLSSLANQHLQMTPYISVSAFPPLSSLLADLVGFTCKTCLQPIHLSQLHCHGQIPNSSHLSSGLQL